MAKLIKMFRAHRGRRLDGHEGDDDGLAELMMMCEAMAEGDGPSADDMECLKACPKTEEVFLQVDAELEKSEGKSIPKEGCAPLEEVLGCMMEAPACEATLEGMMMDEDAVKVIDDSCSDAGLTEFAETKPQTVVENSFKIEGIDLADLSADDQAAMVSGQQESIAKAAGVTKDKVTVTLEAGSINVKALIKVLKSAVAKLEKKMKSPEAKKAIQAGIKASPVLKKAVKAKGKTMDDLKVSEPVVTKKTLPPKKAAKPKGTPQPKATTTKAAAAVADIAAPVEATPVLAMVAATIALFA